MDEKQIRLAAGWIYRKRHTGYWTYPILARDFRADKFLVSLGLSIDEARAVFQALEGKEFLRKMDGQFQTLENFKLQKYEINWAKIAEFKEYATLSFLDRHLPSGVIKFLEYWHTLLVACLILIVTSFFQGFFGEVGVWLKIKIFGAN